MHTGSIIELSLALYGGAVAARRALRALLRRRARKRGVKGKKPELVPCPVEWCIGHVDNLHHPTYRRGHAQPCWDGHTDPERLRRM